MTLLSPFLCVVLSCPSLILSLYLVFFGCHLLDPYFLIHFHHLVFLYFLSILFIINSHVFPHFIFFFVSSHRASHFYTVTLFLFTHYFLTSCTLLHPSFSSSLSSSSNYYVLSLFIVASFASLLFSFRLFNNSSSFHYTILFFLFFSSCFFFSYFVFILIFFSSLSLPLFFPFHFFHI